MSAEKNEGTPSPQESEGTQENQFKKGDRVRLTQEKIKELDKGGYLDGFASTEGEVEVVSGDNLAVNFGGSVRQVEAGEIEKIVEENKE